MSSQNRKTKSDHQTGIIIANDLRSGLTVFLTQSGAWSSRVADAWIAQGEAGVSSALQIAASAESDNVVTGAYLANSNDFGKPVTLRETLRVHGPSIEFMPVEQSDALESASQPLAVGG